jgi:hypothetical protein
MYYLSNLLTASKRHAHPNAVKKYNRQLGAKLIYCLIYLYQLHQIYLNETNP